MASHSSLRTSIRTAVALLAVVGLLGCGGGSSSRNRNNALEESPSGSYDEVAQTLSCDVAWDAAERIVTVCPEADEVKVTFRASNGGAVGTTTEVRNTPLEIPDGVDALIVRVQIAGLNTTYNEPNPSTNEFTWLMNDVNVSQTHTLEYTAPEASPEEKSCDITWNSATSKATACPEVNWIGGRAFNSAGVQVNNQAGPGPVAGFTGPNGTTIMRISIWVAGRTRDNNSPHASVDFEFNVTQTKTVTYLAVDPTTTTAAAEETTTTVEETPVTIEETTVPAPDTTAPVSDTSVAAPDTTAPADTTPSTENVREELAATVSVQESPCVVSFTAATRTVTLCESFDRVVAAAFSADGEFNETFEAQGSTFQIPEKILNDNGARFVRIAVAQKLPGTEVATFRGEGILDITDSTANATGTIYVTPENQEALNNSGFGMSIVAEVTEAGLFDINVSWTDPYWGETYKWEGDFAFVTLNDEVFPEFEKVKPPASWDSGKPLAWRAYFTDGFGIPRLVAGGRLAQGGSSEIDIKNPKFELQSQRIELLTEESTSPEYDPCGQVDPYLITTPTTPAKTNMITLMVSTDCQSPDSILGLVVWGPGDDDPVFSQFKSTKYTSRLSVTLFLADDVYDIQWGDYNQVGEHEYVVNGGGSGGDCTQPRLDVADDGLSAVLRNCDPGMHRMRLWAYPYSGDYEDDVRLPFKNNVVDLSMIEWTGYVWVNLSIDDIYEPDFLVCLRGCEEANASNPDASASIDASHFSTDGTLDVTPTCTNNKSPEGEGWEQVYTWSYSDLYVSSGRGSYIWEAWIPMDGEGPKTESRSVPRTGEILSITGCGADWNNPQADYAWSTISNIGVTRLTLDGPMPNRPANDQFSDAPSIEAGVGKVQFSTVSATNEQGEAGSDFTQSNDPGQFNSVWFKYEPQEDAGMTVRITEYTFSAVIRAWRTNQSGQTVLMDETEVWPEDRYWSSEGDREEWETLRFAVSPGNTYYVQVLNQNFDESVGTGTLVINGGEGSTVKVAAGTEPFVSNADLARATTPTTTPATTTTTTVVTETTVAAGSPVSTVSPAEERYQVAREIGSRTEEVVVLAPTKDAPASIETRQDVRTVQIPVADLYGTVSAASANVDTARSLTLRAPGRRPIHVGPDDKTVSVPVGTKTTDLKITAATTDGKTVVTPLVIKKTAPPLVTISADGDSSSSSTGLYAGIGAGVLVLLLAFFFMKRRKEVDEAVEQA